MHKDTYTHTHICTCTHNHTHTHTHTHLYPISVCFSMLIYYLQAIARSLKFTNNQLRMQLQTVSLMFITVCQATRVHAFQNNTFRKPWVQRMSHVHVDVFVDTKQEHTSLTWITSACKCCINASLARVWICPLLSALHHQLLLFTLIHKWNSKT